MKRPSALLCSVCLLLLLSACQQHPNSIKQIVYSDGYLHLCGDHTERLSLADNSLESYPFQCNMIYLAKNSWIWSEGVHAIRVYHDKVWQDINLPKAGNLGSIFEVHSISETRDGIIWVSSSSLSSYSPQTGQVDVIVPAIPLSTVTPAPKSKSVDIVTMPSSGDIGPIFESADGILWYNQQFDGIVRWDRTNNQKQIWSRDDGFQGWIPIPTKFIQTQNGDIWVGLRHRGVYRWHNGKWQTWLFPSEEGICIPSTQRSCYHRSDGDFTVMDLMEDRRGNVWVAFNRAGVAVWNGSEWNMIGNFEFPAGPMVFYEDFAGTVWIGSLQSGVGKYSNNALTMFPELNIITFAETPDHRLFGGGSDGLFLYDPQSDQWKPYPPDK